MIKTHHAVRPSDHILEAALARSGAMLEAMVAACSLIAHADGEVAPAERRRTLTVLRDKLPTGIFSRSAVAEEIAEHEANFRLDPEVAQQIARERLAFVAGQPRAAQLVIDACRQIIPADGIAHPAEYRILAEIKALLGLQERAPSWSAAARA